MGPIIICNLNTLLFVLFGACFVASNLIASLRDLLVDSRIKSIGSGTPVTQSECDVEKICHLTHSGSPRLQNCQPTHVVDIVDIARVNPRTSPHNTTHARCRLPHRSVMPVTVATNNILFHWIIFARVTHPLSVISTFVDVVIVEERNTIPLPAHLPKPSPVKASRQYCRKCHRLWSLPRFSNEANKCCMFCCITFSSTLLIPFSSDPGPYHMFKFLSITNIPTY